MNKYDMAGPHGYETQSVPQHSPAFPGRPEKTVFTDSKTFKKYKRDGSGRWMEVKGHPGPKRRRDARLQRRLATHAASVWKMRQDVLFRLAEHEEYLQTL